jgi:hypothetical protein
MSIKLASNDNTDTKVLLEIKGEGLSGKSTLASKLGTRVLFINTDGNTASQGFNTVEVSSVDEIKSVLIDTDITKYDTVVIDTLDEVERLIELKAIKDYNSEYNKNIKALSEVPYGQLTGVSNNRKFTFIDFLANFVKKQKKANVILIERTGIIDAFNDKKIELSEISQKLKAYTLGRVDAIINVSKDHIASFSAFRQLDRLVEFLKPIKNILVSGDFSWELMNKNKQVSQKEKGVK